MLGVLAGISAGPPGGGRVAASAARGPSTPKGYTRVVRWVSEKEAEIWKGRRTIPQLIKRQHGRISVSLPGSPRACAASGQARLEFDVPSHALQKGGRPDWRLIFHEGRSVPIENLTISR